jgi:hypothetical protein
MNRHPPATVDDDSSMEIFVHDHSKSAQNNKICLNIQNEVPLPPLSPSLSILNTSDDDDDYSPVPLSPASFSSSSDTEDDRTDSSVVMPAATPVHIEQEGEETKKDIANKDGRKKRMRNLSFESVAKRQSRRMVLEPLSAAQPSGSANLVQDEGSLIPMDLWFLDFAPIP